MPISPRMMCPAVKLAASRKERVIGRTLILRVSMMTRNGFSQSGAPLGSSLAMVDLGPCVTPERIIDSHRGSPKVRVIMRWLDMLKVYGTSPMRLLKIKVINRAVRMVGSLFKWVPNVRLV